jgi:mannose-6-phosphate isomerase-like protein (cupin superfamily)
MGISSAGAVGPSEGRAFTTPFESTARVKVRPTKRGFVIIESGPAVGRAQQPQVHDEYDEAFYVTAGQVLFQLGDREVMATTGPLCSPRGHDPRVRHTGREDARMLVVATPGAPLASRVGPADPGA